MLTIWNRSIRSHWFFPAILLVLILILAAFRISGTSVGAYHQLLYGPTVADKNLLYGQPQMIRSDEWLVNTAFIVSQSHFGYPRINPTVASGLDTSVILDLPNKDWSEIFKPQNWSFFVLPVEQAFAFKWWFVGYLLIVSSYFLVLTFLPKQRNLAILLSLSLFFSPFIQWWYQAMTVSPVYYACLALILFIHLTQATKLKPKIWLSLGLAYILTSFALILYPPFQIPCAMVAAAVGIGYFIQQNRPLAWRPVLKRLAPVGVSVVLTGLLILAFFLTHKDTISAISNTVYPGHRVVQSGGYSMSHFLDGAFDRQLQTIGHAANYIGNQSETSNFLYLWPFLIIPSLLMSYRKWKRTKQLDYPLLFINGLIFVFMARLFLPLPDGLAKILLLQSIPHNRLLLGMGFLSLVQLIFVLKQFYDEKIPRRWPFTIGLLAFATQLMVGYSIRSSHPMFLSSPRLIIGLSFAVGLMVYLFLKQRVVLAAALLLIVAFGSTYKIHPLYVGLGELTHSKLNDAAHREPGSQSQGWAYLGSITTINLLQAGGLKSYTTTYPYPQLAYDKKLDPTGAYKDVYNRYGFGIFVINNPQVHGFALNGEDSYLIDYKPCENRFKQDIRHIVSQSELHEDCLKLDTTVSYPNQFYYLYSVQ